MLLESEVSRIQVLAGSWGSRCTAVLTKSHGARILNLTRSLGRSERIDLQKHLAHAVEIGSAQDLLRLGWTIDLVRRAPLEMTKPQGLVWFAAHLTDGRRLVGATDRETFTLIQGSAVA